MTTALHNFVPEEIMAHQDAELPADRAQQLAAHLETCAECREQLESLRNISQTVAMWRVDQAPQSLTPEPTLSSFGNRAHESIDFSGFWRRLHNRRMAVVLGLAVSVVGFLFIEIDTSKTSHFQAPAMDVTAVDVSNYVAKIPFSGSYAAGGGGGGDERSTGDGSRLPSQNLRRTAPEDVISEPLIARTVQLQIVVKQFSEARAAVQSVLTRHQGYAASLNVGDTENTARTLNASLRIPSQELPAALAELKSLGHVSNESQAGEEVTAEHADLVARLKNSRETETRLQDILRNRTGKVADVLEVEQEIARVRGEIEQMESELKTLNHRVDFATINLTITEEYKAKVSDSTPGVATRFHNAAVAGFKNVTDSAVGLTLWFAEYLPPMVFWLIILVAPIVIFWRFRRRAIAAVFASPVG
jgi:hypothetical protein